MGKQGKYSQIIVHIFKKYYTQNAEIVYFEREDIDKAAKELGLKVPKNIGDNIYSFKSRAKLPEEITEKAPIGKAWVIKNLSNSKYAFVTTSCARILPDQMLTEIKIPDATPGLVAKYALSDEQALLAKLRYNRIVDIFTGVTCYSYKITFAQPLKI